MRHDLAVGQASDQASDSVGQAGAGGRDDKSKARAHRWNWRPVSLSGQSRSPAPTWQRSQGDRGRQAARRTAYYEPVGRDDHSSDNPEAFSHRVFSDVG